MKNDQYFPFEVQFLSNEDLMEMLFELDAPTAMGVYIMLLIHLRKMDDYVASCKPRSIDAIAYMYRIDRDILEKVIRDFKLFEIDEEHQTFRSYYLDRVMKRLEERRCINTENGKKGGRPKKKSKTSETPMDKGGKPNENQESKEKESKEEKSKRSITTSEREKEKSAEEGESVEGEVLTGVETAEGTMAITVDDYVWDEEEGEWVYKDDYYSG